MKRGITQLTLTITFDDPVDLSADDLYSLELAMTVQLEDIVTGTSYISGAQHDGDDDGEEMFED